MSDDRPDGCECSDGSGESDLPCFECFCAGFDDRAESGGAE